MVGTPDPPVLITALAVGFAVVAFVLGISRALDHDHRASRERLEGIAQERPHDEAPRNATRRHRRAGSSRSGMRRWLRRAGLRWEPADFIGVTAACTLVPPALVAAIVGVGGMAIVAALVGSVVPLVLVHRRAQARASALNAQVVETLEIVASSLGSGFGFVQSVELAAREQRDPIADELLQCIREINLGASTDEALLRLVERAGDADLELAVDAVVIQRRVGGDLSEVLGNIARMIR